MARAKYAGQQVKKVIEADADLTAADLTKLASTGATVASGTQQAHIADVTVTGTYADDDDAIETAINSIIAALEAFGITATS